MHIPFSVYEWLLQFRYEQTITAFTQTIHNVHAIGGFVIKREECESQHFHLSYDLLVTHWFGGNATDLNYFRPDLFVAFFVNGSSIMPGGCSLLFLIFYGYKIARTGERKNFCMRTMTTDGRSMTIFMATKLG